MSEDAVEYLVAKHIAAARQRCPSLAGKTVTPHTLRHTAAMQLLQRGVDRSVIALWLGHESIETTQLYLHADIQPQREGPRAHSFLWACASTLSPEGRTPDLPGEPLIIPRPPGAASADCTLGTS